MAYCFIAENAGSAENCKENTEKANDNCFVAKCAKNDKEEQRKATARTATAH